MLNLYEIEQISLRLSKERKQQEQAMRMSPAPMRGIFPVPLKERTVPRLPSTVLTRKNVAISAHERGTK